MTFTNRRARMAFVAILLTAAAFGLKHSAAWSLGHSALNRAAPAAGAGATASASQHGAATRSRAIEAFGRSPLRFEANQGQAGARVKFISRNSGYTLFLSANEAAIKLRPPEMPERHETVRMKFVNAATDARLFGMEKMASASNYFIGGDPARWRVGVVNFGRVKQRAVWPGIDVVWYGNQRLLEHDFIVAPGADPRKIRLEFSGASGMGVDKEGALELRTGAGGLRLLRPAAWQVSDSGREAVACDYRVNGAGQVEFRLGEYDKNRELVIDPAITLATWFGGADADEARNVAVDKDGAVYIAGATVSVDFPVANSIQQNKAALTDAFVLKLSPDGRQVVYATYLGGGGNDQALSVAVDAAGAAYVAGVTTSTDFPTTPGTSQTSFKGFSDGFVTRLNANGSALVWSSLAGGDGVDVANDLAVDGAGNVYVAGRTTSTDLPANGFQTSRGGSSVYRSSDSGGAWNPGAGVAGTTTYGLTIDPSNPNVIYAATDLGVYKSVDGGGRWRATAFTGVAYDVAVDPRNAATIYVAAQGQLARSVNGGESFTFKASPQNFFGSNSVYSALVDAQTPATVYVGTEKAAFKSVDGGENWTPSFIFGTQSISVRVTRLIAYPNNPASLFAGTDRGVFKSADAGANWSLALAGASLGGFSNSNSIPGIRALAIDPAQTATIYAGLNNTGSVYKSTNGGMTWSRGDAGIGDGNQVTLINALAVGSAQTVYAAGSTGIYKSADGGANWSLANSGLNNPLVLSLAVDRNNVANVYAGTVSGADAFVAKLNAGGSALSWLTYLGGALSEDGAAIAIDRDGNSYIAGSTSSSNFPVAGQIQNFGGGSTDAFAAKLDPAGAALVWSTYLGGVENEIGYDIAVNASSEAYVVGSSALFGGQRDAYIHKVRADGSSLA
ncbi:MAG: hypothetical protein JMDDDDMK_01585 [Acidobacteria bacterium]|nr:hypothetical protein [Acidobacteriota bacterium]